MIRRDHKNVAVLATCQMLYGTGRALFMVSAPAVALVIAPHPALWTLPAATVVVGTALSAMAASMFMRRTGRKAGFLWGTTLGVASGAACAAAVVLQNFWLLALGGLLYGFFSGFAQLYRFAVADVATEHFRSKAISLVLAGGVFAALAGPNLAKVGKDLFDNALFAGGFLFIVATAVAAAVVLMYLDIPNLSRSEREGPQRPLLEIMRQPVFVAAALSATVAQTVMNFLMTATPIAMMEICGHSFNDTADVIAWHTVGMFAPGFVTGHLIRKFGEVRMIMAGLVLEGMCIGIALSGIAVFDFWLALLLLGVGWNFTFTASTALLVTAYTPAERAKTQGLMNQIIYTVVALGALMSGTFVHYFGWDWVNIGAAPMLIAAAGVTIWYAIGQRKAAVA